LTSVRDRYHASSSNAPPKVTSGARPHRQSQPEPDVSDRSRSQQDWGIRETHPPKLKMAPTAGKDDKPDDDVLLPPEVPHTTTVYLSASSQSMANFGGYPTNSAALSAAVAGGIVSTSIDSYGNTVFLYSNTAFTTQTNSPSPTRNSPSSQQTGIAESTNPQSDASLPSATPGNSNQPPPAKPWEYEQRHGPPVTFIAMGIVIPLLIILFALAMFFWYRRYKRNQRANEENIATVMAATQSKGTQPNMVQTAMPYIHTPGAPRAAAAVVPSPTSTTASPTSNVDQPVILTTTMNNTYYTGIDTSDHISLSDQRSQTSAESIHGEEPPPPYRPRSVPPISRETSLRQAVLGRNSSVRSARHDPMSGAGLIRRSDEVRSPFDDPESSDDDALSQISTIRSYPRHQSDRLSVVSDMSEEDNEQSTRSAV
jgi:hypothetical protein